MQYVFSKVHCNFNWLKQCFSADAWRSPIKVSPEALAVSWLIHLSVISVFICFHRNSNIVFKQFIVLNSISVCCVWAILIVLFVFFPSSRTYNWQRSRSSQTQPTHQPIRKPGQCTSSLVNAPRKSWCYKSKQALEGGEKSKLNFLINVFCNCTCRLEETFTPSKLLSAETVPHVIFTGFEPANVQQYTKVGFFTSPLISRGNVSSFLSWVFLGDVKNTRFSALGCRCCFLWVVRLWTAVTKWLTWWPQRWRAPSSSSLLCLWPNTLSAQSG